MKFASRIRLSNAPSKGVRIELLRSGEFFYKGRKVDIPAEKIDQFAEDFTERGEPWPELPMNLNHDDPNFTISRGWIKGLKSIVNKRGGKSLMALVRPTPAIQKRIDDGEIKYVSAEIDQKFMDRASGLKKWALRGAAWTNIPYLQGMGAAEVINFADLRLDDSGDDGGDDDLDYDDSDSNEVGAQGLPRLADAQDEDALSDGLPNQCRTCKLLFSGDCPFHPVEVKMAAAGEGNCPQYLSWDSATSLDGNQTAGKEKMAGTGKENEVQLSDLLERLDSVEASNKLLMEQNKLMEGLLTTQRDTHLQFSAKQQRTTDHFTLKSLIDDGRVNAHEAKQIEIILHKVRGEEGKITLSDVNGSEELELSSTTAEEDLIALFAGMDPRGDFQQIADGVANGAVLRLNYGGNEANLQEQVAKREQELDRSVGRPDRGSNYSRALREVTAEIAQKRVGA